MSTFPSIDYEYMNNDIRSHTFVKIDLLFNRYNLLSPPDNFSNNYNNLYVKM